MKAERTFTDVLQDIVRNVQDIVRAEIRLAKTEIREETKKAKVAAKLFALGAVAGLYALLFLLFAAVYGLTLVLPAWAAAGIVGAVLAGLAAFLLSAGYREFKVLRPMPETTKTIKENVEWAKQQTR